MKPNPFRGWVIHNTKTNKKYICKTNEEAEFNIKIPPGAYMIYGIGEKIRKENQNKLASQIKINIMSNYSFKVTIID